MGFRSLGNENNNNEDDVEQKEKKRSIGEYSYICMTPYGVNGIHFRPSSTEYEEREKEFKGREHYPLIIISPLM
eukprot:gene10328-7222_t